MMRSETPLVSVIMPVYNGVEYLAGAIGSLLAQTYPHWELVLVDDGSTDDTAVIAQSFADPRIRYHYQENRGQAAALNTGLGLARGEFVTTLDADDVYPPHSLADRVARFLLHPEVGVVYGDGVYCYETGEPFLKFTEQMPSGATGDVYDLVIVSPFFGTGATMMIRKAVLDAHELLYDESIVWCQDWDFYIRVAEVTPFEFVPTITIEYRMHGAGMTVAMPQGRRLESLIRMRHKVMASPRFGQVSDAQKAAFFYDVLTQDLWGDVAAQEGVFDGAAFALLSAGQQARLLRLTAVKYYLAVQEQAMAKRWLRRAWKAQLTDPKTAVVTVLVHLNRQLATAVIQRWQAQAQPAGQKSPFELATAVPTPPSL
jgi:glycosyltransferase involved in cell wall biosynthesis